MEFTFSLDGGLWPNDLETTVERLRREAVLRRARSMELSERVEVLEAENNELRLVINLLMQALRERGALRDEDLHRIAGAVSQVQSEQPPGFVVAEPEPVVEETSSEDLAALAAATERREAEQAFKEMLTARPALPEAE
jgi:hypothetical protein